MIAARGIPLCHACNSSFTTTSIVNVMLRKIFLPFFQCHSFLQTSQLKCQQSQNLDHKPFIENRTSILHTWWNYYNFRWLCKEFKTYTCILPSYQLQNRHVLSSFCIFPFWICVLHVFLYVRFQFSGRKKNWTVFLNCVYVI